MNNLEKDSSHCERCSVLRLAHELAPVKANYYVWSEFMRQSAVCMDCADEARSLGLLVKPIQNEPRTPKDHVPGRVRGLFSEK